MPICLFDANHTLLHSTMAMRIGLIREGKTFYFSGSKGLEDYARRPAYQALENISSIVNPIGSLFIPKKGVYAHDIKYYQVDMETGQVY